MEKHWGIRPERYASNPPFITLRGSKHVANSIATHLTAAYYPYGGNAYEVVEMDDSAAEPKFTTRQEVIAHLQRLMIETKEPTALRDLAIALRDV